MNKILLLVTVVLCTLHVPGISQSEFSLYSLRKTVSQSHQLNPAFTPDAKLTIGIPFLSSIYESINLDQLKFNSLFTEGADDSLQLDYDKIIGALNDKNNLKLFGEVQVFNFGLKKGKNYFSFAFNERFNIIAIYPKDLAELAFYGNSNTRTLGRNLNMNALFLDQNYFHEFAFGFSREINSRLSVGARVKFLYGVLNTHSGDVQAFIRTDADSLHISNTAFSVSTSGWQVFDQNADLAEIAMNSLPFKNPNKGLGIDLGATYYFTNNLHVAASVIDIGYLKWKDDTREFQFDQVNYSFKGFDLLEIINTTGPQNNLLQVELDSLKALYTPNELEGEVYSSTLQPKLYASLNYDLGRKHSFGANFYGEFKEGLINPALSASYNFKLNRMLNVAATASLKNGNFNNFGAGMSLNLGSYQIYATSDNLNSLIKPENASRLNLRVGMNLTFGRKKEKKKNIEKKEEQEEEQEEIEKDQEEIVPEEPDLEPITFVAPVVAVALPEEEKQDSIPVIELIEEEPEPLVEEQIEEKPAPLVEVVKGDHPDELKMGNYVIVGAFSSFENVKKYSQSLKAEGFDNEYGFLTEKNYYYVYIHYNNTNLEEARRVRNEYRKTNKFLFEDTWLLRVVEKK